MKRYFRPILIVAAALLAVTACHKASGEGNTDDSGDPVPEKEVFAKGADISWATEMEDKGYKFYNARGQERECTALMSELGMNAVRYRVWVNPEDRYNTAADVLVKARRAQALGMDIMIDFHYSDWWADPGKQTVPAVWADYTPSQMRDAVASHTSSVLRALKDAGIDNVRWVQVGNEVNGGMLWESGRVKGNDAANFITYLNAGYKAVKGVYPDAEVILHLADGWNASGLKWFYDLMEAGGADYDIIGLSLYPSYWDDKASSFPDWKAKTRQFTANLPALERSYGKPVMLVEFGMPVSQPDKAKEALQYIIDNTSQYNYFKGIFLWEPESEHSRNGYDYGAFENGRPTAALDPFAN